MAKTLGFVLVLAVLVAASACGGGPSALEVCQKLEAGGVAKDCKEASPTGVNATAKEMVEYEIPAVSGRGGVVLKFSDTNTYDNTLRAYSQLGSRNADFRYGSRRRRVFTAMNERTPQDVADKAKGVIEAL